MRSLDHISASGLKCDAIFEFTAAHEPDDERTRFPIKTRPFQAGDTAFDFCDHNVCA